MPKYILLSLALLGLLTGCQHSNGGATTPVVRPPATPPAITIPPIPQTPSCQGAFTGTLPIHISPACQAEIVASGVPLATLCSVASIVCD